VYFGKKKPARQLSEKQCWKKIKEVISHTFLCSLCPFNAPIFFSELNFGYIVLYLKTKKP